MFKFWYEFIPKGTSVIEMGQGTLLSEGSQAGFAFFYGKQWPIYR